MNAMTFCGRRGELVWGKKGRQYDTFLVNFGMALPFSLGEFYHVWDFPMTVFGSCKAIPLKPDNALKTKALLKDWMIVGGICVLVGCPFLWKVHDILGIVSLLLGIALFVGG